MGNLLQNIRDNDARAHRFKKREQEEWARERVLKLQRKVRYLESIGCDIEAQAVRAEFNLPLENKAGRVNPRIANYWA